MNGRVVTRLTGSEKMKLTELCDEAIVDELKFELGSYLHMYRVDYEMVEVHLFLDKAGKLSAYVVKVLNFPVAKAHAVVTKVISQYRAAQILLVILRPVLERYSTWL